MSRQSTGMLGLITALVALGVLSMALYVPSLPAIRDEFGVTTDAVQRTLTVFLGGFAVAQLIIGPLSDSLGRRPVLLGGLVAYAAASLLCALAPDITWLTVARFLQGFAACVGPVVGRAVVRDLFEGEAASRAFSLVGTALAIVPALAPILGGVIQANLGWEAAFLTLGAIGIALGGVSLLRLRETLGEPLIGAMAPRRLAGIYANLFRNGPFMGHAMAGGFTFGGFFAYFSDAPFLFIDVLGIAPDIFGLLMIFTVTGYASGSFLSGRLVRRLTPRRLILIGTGLSVTASLLLLILSDQLSLGRVIGPMTLYTFGFGLALPASLAGALAPFPRAAGSASALLGFIQMAAGGVASLAVQPLYDGTASSLGLVVLGMSGAAFLGHAILTRPSKGTPAKGTPAGASP
jgi:DHA1 family bicyclomycin/chloramphenicol resistance-like MFS transporter